MNPLDYSQICCAIFNTCSVTVFIWRQKIGSGVKWIDVFLHVAVSLADIVSMIMNNKLFDTEDVLLIVNRADD